MHRFGAFLAASALVACSSGNGDSGPAPFDAGDDGQTSSDTAIVEDSLVPDVAPSDAPTDAAFVSASHLAFPQISTVDHAVLSPLKLVTIVATGDTVGAKFTQFGDALVASQWWVKMQSEYGLGAATNVDVTGPAMTSTMTDTQLDAYIQALIDGGKAPEPDGNTMYMVYLPNGVTYSDSEGLNSDCQYSEGAHFQFGKGHDNWAYAQRCAGDGADGIDDATNTAAHEIIESVTDPTGNGWGLAAPPSRPWMGDPWRTMDFGYIAEVADLCDGAAYEEGGFQYARAWSNAAATAGADPCVPAIGEPYYSVSPTVGWTAIPIGTSADVALTAWSSAPTGDWVLETAEYDSSTSGLITATISAARSKTITGTTYPLVNNGEAATLHVTVPASAHHGDWITFGVYSDPITSPATDLYHDWPVGVYVP